MKNTFLKTIIFIFCLIYALPNNAQTASPVSWVSYVQTNADKQQELHVKATIKNGYHIFTNTPGDADGALIATSLTLVTKNKAKKEISTNITDRYTNKKPTNAKLEGIGAVNYYEQDIEYVFPISKENFNTTSTVQITYQCCNDKMCFPPITVTLKPKLQSKK